MSRAAMLDASANARCVPSFAESDDGCRDGDRRERHRDPPRLVAALKGLTLAQDLRDRGGGLCSASSGLPRSLASRTSLSTVARR